MRTFSPVSHRLFLAAGALAVMLAVAAMQQKNDPPEHLFRITLGLADKEPTDWNGQVAVVGGAVSKLAGWRFEDKDAVQDNTGWKCRTHVYIPPEQRYPLQA